MKRGRVKNMKKLFSAILVGLLVMALAACGASSSSDSKKDSDEKAKGSSDVSLEELFEKTQEANEQLKSFSSEMEMAQVMEMDGEKIDMSTTMTMDIITDPLNMKQLLEMDMGELGKQEMEIYLTEEDMYFFDPSQEEWMKFPSEFSKELMQLSDAQTNPGAELEQFKAYMDDFTLEDEKDSYKLTLKAKGDKFNELFNETLKESMPESLGLDDSLLDNIQFNNVEYEILIDKETYYFTAVNVSMDYEMTMEDEKTSIKQDIKSTYSNYNGIDEIKVPKEAIENAVEIAM